MKSYVKNAFSRLIEARLQQARREVAHYQALRPLDPFGDNRRKSID